MTVELPMSKMELLDHGVEQGVQWVTCRAPLYGAANGYVKIPSSHHWHGLDYDDINVDVHGGLTYGGGPSGWIGFDTLHSGDVWPGSPDYVKDSPWGRSWTDELVAREARSLARKVAAAAYETADLSGSTSALYGDDE